MWDNEGLELGECLGRGIHIGIVHLLSLYTAPTEPALPPKGSWEFGAKAEGTTVIATSAIIFKCLQHDSHSAKSISCKMLLR